MDEPDRKNEVLNFMIFKEFLSRLGFINQNLLILNQPYSKENKTLLNDLWNSL
jgi:hypothetical protein